MAAMCTEMLPERRLLSLESVACCGCVGGGTTCTGRNASSLMLEILRLAFFCNGADSNSPRNGVLEELKMVIELDVPRLLLFPAPLPSGLN